MNEKRKPVYEFGPFRMASAEGLLTRNGQAIRLPPKAFELLLFLLENRGRVVGKEMILTSVWSGTFVEESNLTKNVFLLRRCLGAREGGRPYIETFPKRGYRFDADVRERTATEFAHAPAEVGASTPGQDLGAFVGRDQQLRRLKTLMEQTIDGAGKIALLSGEAGIGKTALAESFLAWIRQRHPNILAARGVCVEQYGAGEAYLPFLDAVTSLLRTCAKERALTALQANAPAWCLHLPSIASCVERDRIQYETIGATKERMLREMGDFLGALTAEIPVVLLLEDLHWADQSTADLLHYLGCRIGSQRLLMIGTYRPEDVEISKHPLGTYVRELSAHRVCEEFPLEALPDQDVGAYLNARFAPNDFPSEIAALIARKTEGHPLFLSGLADFLIERGDITWNENSWILTRPPAELSLEVPLNVRSIIRNRIERLEESDRRLLEYASIEGEEFTSTMVSALLELEEVAVQEQLDRIDKVHRLVRRLEEQELPDGSAAIRYRFAHALYQNVLYGRLVPARRVMLHRRAGKELLRLCAGQESQAAAQLATHFERGRDFTQAVEHLLETGDNACRLYDNMAALHHYSHALKLTEKLPELERSRRRLLAYRKRGAAQMALGRLSEAEDDLRSALDQARSLKDALAECLALNALANSLIPSHKLADLDAAATEARRIAERIGSQPLRAEAVTNQGLASMASGSIRKSAKLLKEAIPVARACDHMPALIPALTFGGLLHNFRSDYQQAEVLEAEASALASKVRDGFYLPLSLFYLGIIRINLGRFSEALATLTEGLEMARRNGNRVVLARIPNAIGWAYRELRDIPRAIDYDRMSAEMAREMKLAEAEAHALINLAHDYSAAGEAGLAIAALRQAEPLLERDPWYHWRFFDIRLQAATADVWLAQNELDSAHKHATRLLASARRHEARKYMALARNLLAETAMAAGENERAAIEARKAIAEIGPTSPAPLAAWKSWEILGRALLRIGDRDSARQAFAEGAAILKTILANIGDQNLCATFLNAPDVRAVFMGITQPRGGAATELASELPSRARTERR